MASADSLVPTESHLCARPKMFGASLRGERLLLALGDFRCTKHLIHLYNSKEQTAYDTVYEVNDAAARTICPFAFCSYLFTNSWLESDKCTQEWPYLESLEPRISHLFYSNDN